MVTTSPAIVGCDSVNTSFHLLSDPPAILETARLIDHRGLPQGGGRLVRIGGWLAIDDRDRSTPVLKRQGQAKPLNSFRNPFGIRICSIAFDPIRVIGSVPGIGERTARRIHDTLGISTLEELEIAAHDGRLTQAMGLGAKRVAGERDSLAGRLGRVRHALSDAHRAPPSIVEVLDVDIQYRRDAAQVGSDMNERRTEHRAASSCWRILVAISATHVHLTPALIEELFCDSYQLHEQSRLAQPTQYTAEESVTLIGPRGRLSNIRLIGPPRSANQVEISQRDALALGICVPVRGSGDLEGTPGILIEGPRTRVRLECGAIRTLHHIHMSPTDAANLGLKDGDRITVTTKDHARPLSLRDVLVRVSPDYRLELHLDPDEADAVGLRSGDYVIALPRRADSEHTS